MSFDNVYLLLGLPLHTIGLPDRLCISDPGLRYIEGTYEIINSLISYSLSAPIRNSFFSHRLMILWYGSLIIAGYSGIFKKFILKFRLKLLSHGIDQYDIASVN